MAVTSLGFGFALATLGLIWNRQRFRSTKRYSSKYKTVVMLGVVQILISLLALGLGLA